MMRTLRPVSFRYNDNDSASTTYWGFIAEEAASTSPQLAYFNLDGTVQTINSTAILSLTVKALGELDLNLLTIASSTASSTEESRSFADNFFGNIFSRLIEWFADTANGVGKFFAREVHTDTLCIKKSDGTDVCVTGDQLANLLSGQSIVSAPEPTPVPTSEPTTTEPISTMTEPAPEPIPTSEPTIIEPALTTEPAPKSGTIEPIPEPTPTPEPTVEPASGLTTTPETTVAPEPVPMETITP